MAQTDPAGRVVALQGYGEPGEFTVVVEAPEYATWAASGVRVRAAQCGPETVRLDARLQSVRLES